MLLNRHSHAASAGAAAAAGRRSLSKGGSGGLKLAADRRLLPSHSQSLLPSHSQVTQTRYLSSGLILVYRCVGSRGPPPPPLSPPPLSLPPLSTALILVYVCGDSDIYVWAWGGSVATGTSEAARRLLAPPSYDTHTYIPAVCAAGS